MKIKFIITLFLMTLSHAQVYNVGDIAPSDFGLPWCGNNPAGDDSLFLSAYNGAINESGRPYVIWMVGFTTWCPYCITEVPYTQDFYDLYSDSGLVVIGMGGDWGQPYTCDEWVDNFGLGYPIISDEDTYNEYEYGGLGTNLFTDTWIPYNIIMDHNMEIIFSQSGTGTEDEMNEIFDQITMALNHCSFCTCSEVLGDIDYTYTTTNEPIINIFDLLRLSDLIESNIHMNHCERGQGDVTGDGVLNTIDLFAFATMLSEGTFDN